MNQISTPTAPDNVLTVLRRLLPTRKLRLFEHQVIAEQQAMKLHELLNQTGPAADLGWLTKLKNITVVLQPRWKMDGLSGMSSFDDGHWVIGVNKGNPHARRRFTLCHELKHVLDADHRGKLFAVRPHVCRDLVHHLVKHRIRDPNRGRGIDRRCRG